MIKLTALFLAVTAVVLTLFFVLRGRPYDPPDPPVTTTTAAMTTTQAAPTRTETIAVNRAQIMGLFADSEYEATVESFMSYAPNNTNPRPDRTFIGVPLKVILAELGGIDLNDIASNAYLIVTASDGASARFNYTQYSFMADSSLLAWYEINDEQVSSDVFRSCLASGPASNFVKNVVSLTLYY